MRKIILTIALFIFPFWLAKSVGSKDLYFTNIHEEKDLIVTYTDCIAQDENGFIWFEYDGLSRFDGNSLVTYSMSLDDSSSIVSNSLNVILPDNAGYLWIGTQKGLSRFNLSTHKFKNYNTIFPESIGTQFIKCLCKMDENHLFIGTTTLGVYILNTQTNALKHFYAKTENDILSNSIYKIVKNKKNHYWIATENGLNLYDPADDSFTDFIVGESIRDIILDSDNRLWVSSYNNENITVLDANSGKQLESLDMPVEFKEKQKRLTIDSKGFLWIAILDRGAYQYDIKRKKLREVRDNSGLELRTFPDAMRVFEDNSNNIWITTFNKGLFFYDRTESPFQVIKNRYKYKDRYATSVRVVYQDNEGCVWMGAREIALLSCLNSKTGRIENYKLPVADGNKFEDDIIWCITEIGKNKLLLSTLHSGLIEFDKITKRFKAKRYNPDKPDKLKSNSIYTVLKDKSGYLWIGYSTNGIDRYDPRTDTYKHYDAYDQEHHISNNMTRCIYEDKQGDIWIGTMNGLNKYNRSKDTFESYYSDSKNPATLTDARINDVYEDSRFILWVGTYLGLDRFDRETGTVKRYTKKDGYSFSNTFKILEDNTGNLWLNGERGLSKFNVLSEEFENFSASDGLQNTIFYHTGVKLDDGRLAFGGKNGLICFDAEEVQQENKVYDIRITDLELFNKPVKIGDDSPLKNDIAKTDFLTLSYKDKVITLKYSALCFNNTDKIEYAYRMVGVEDEWNYVKDQRRATYSNLKPGHYVFEVMAAVNGHFNASNKKLLYLEILPPFWRTWWAYLFYVLVVTMCLFYYRRILIKRHEQLRKKEVEQERVKFFINISHEFRTPLTIMLNPLREAKEDAGIDNNLKEKISIAYRSALKLLQLVTQLQDFRRLDFQIDKLEVQKVEIDDYIEKLTSLFNSLAESKDISLCAISELKQQYAYVDIDKLDKILNNLISNALKYTGRNGSIVIRTKIYNAEDRNGIKRMLKQQSDERFLQISVEDTGVGIAQKQITRIFERFYQVESTNTGAGIGLNLVKSLVERHHGVLIVDSEVGKGSKFIVRVPLDRDSYSEDEVIDTEEVKVKPVGNTILDSLEYDLKVDLADEEEPETQTEKSGTILIVEDNKSLLSQLRLYLGEKYKIYTAVNGEDGFQKALKRVPDLIISDVMMPVMDGIEMCTKIKNTEETCNIPIFLLTAKDRVEDRMEGLEIGADAYISKPFYIEELETRIKNILESRRKLKEQFKSRSIFSDMAEEHYENKDELFLNKVTNVVLENIDNIEFSIKDLCKELSIGNSYLFNKLTKLTGQNPSRFVRSIRLKYSVELLMKEGMAIKEACYQSGFNSPPYFTKVFNEYYGCSPSEYVRRHRGNGAEA